jgi:hypothetical protein
MTLKEMAHALDEKLRTHILEHHKLHNDFDAYRGRTLDKDEAEKVEEIYNKIQASYWDMYDVLNFIRLRDVIAKEEQELQDSLMKELIAAQLLKEEKNND